MGGKAKQQKHSAASLAAKASASLQNRGGGKAGKKDRMGGKTGHAKFVCPVCKQQAPDLKSMENHHNSKHSKLPWQPEKCVDSHKESGGQTTVGVAVRGSVKKGKAKGKDKK